MTLTKAQSEAVLARWLGKGVKCTQIRPLTGGMINSVCSLEFDREPSSAVLKLSASPDGSFAYEARALKHMREVAGFPCPRVYLEGPSAKCDGFSFLLLETMPGVSLPSARLTAADKARIDTELAEALLDLHSHKRDSFGGIGEKPGKERWTDVFVPRLRQVRRDVADKLPDGTMRDIDRALEAADEVMSAYGRPSLVHGDIWATNIMVARGSDGWHLAGLIDPGAQYADVEMELAYIDVFATAGRAFFETYARGTPVRPGYGLRRLFYWLHTYMIHVAIFGDEHFRRMTTRVASELARRL